MRSLGRLKPKDPKYAATFKVLCEYIIDLRALGAKLMARKVRLAG